MPLNRASVEASGPRTGRRFWLTTLVGGVAMFAAWCVGDYVLVRFAPSRINDFGINDFDLAFALLPFAVGYSSAVVLRHVKLGARVGLSIAAAVLASIAAALLVLFVGLPFHFLIGGTK
jgi:hypothetical protein